MENITFFNSFNYLYFNKSRPYTSYAVLITYNNLRSHAHKKDLQYLKQPLTSFLKKLNIKVPSGILGVTLIWQSMFRQLSNCLFNKVTYYSNHKISILHTEDDGWACQRFWKSPYKLCPPDNPSSMSSRSPQWNTPDSS